MCQPNPFVSLPPEYFLGALRSYQEWPIKWWREAVQNGVDAGANHIRMSSVQQDDGTWLVSCEDNGSGMDDDTLVDKFFAMGGTGKGLMGASIGGFGKAKELLTFAWPAWSIWTRGTFVQGSGGYYEELEQAPSYKQGTLLTVTMPGDRYTTPESALELLGRSSTVGVNYHVNEEHSAERLLKGKKIKDIDLGPTMGTLYQNKSAKRGVLYVRVDGLYMFTGAHFDESIGTLILEIPGEFCREVLQDNRDGFRRGQIGWEISDLVREIAIEGQKALKPSRAFTRVWEGTGLVGTDEGMTDVLNAMVPTEAPPPDEPLDISGDDAARILGVLGAIAPRLTQQIGTLELTPATADIAEQILTAPIKGSPNQEALAQQLVWAPAFMLSSEDDNYLVPRKFYPEDMAPKVKALLKVWTEACRWVFIQLGSTAQYGVGFVFAEDVGAAHVCQDGVSWLLLNPLSRGFESEKIFSKSSRADLKWLYAAAIHECTHMAGGLHYHDQAFAYSPPRKTQELQPWDIRGLPLLQLVFLASSILLC